MVEQEEPVVERCVPQTDGKWGTDATVGLDAEFGFAAVAARVRPADQYDGVSLPDPPR